MGGMLGIVGRGRRIVREVGGVGKQGFSGVKEVGWEGALRAVRTIAQLDVSPHTAELLLSFHRVGFVEECWIGRGGDGHGK